MVALDEWLLIFQKLVNFVFTIVMIVICWFSLQSIHWEKLVVRSRIKWLKILMIVLAIVLGDNLAKFFLHYFSLNNSQI